jgi:hypothetical protein
MPQGPIPANVAVQPNSSDVFYSAPLQLDVSGNLIVGEAQSSHLDCTAGTIVKATPGRLCKVVVTTAGAAGAVYDHSTTSGVGASSLIGTVPATIGIYDFNWPCAVGIVYVPGASQVASISFS